jgi:hypothetical protein
MNQVQKKRRKISVTVADTWPLHFSLAPWAIVNNERNHSSAPPVCFDGVGWDQFTPLSFA